jgi:hypothetical protein
LLQKIDKNSVSWILPKVKPEKTLVQKGVELRENYGVMHMKLDPGAQGYENEIPGLGCGIG